MSVSPPASASRFWGTRSPAWTPTPRKLIRSRRGQVPFFEPHLADLVAAARGNLSYTTDYAQAIPAAEVIFIAVGTPPA